jgi:aspartate carbamoyltransferase catalytic subunit
MAGEVDVIYQTRIRPDRVEDRSALDRYTINERLLRRMKADAMILHPLPRTVEIDKAVDDDPRALYFKQAANGLVIRMALLTLLFDGE